MLVTKSLKGFLAVIIVASTVAAHAVNIETVPVGDAGNVADTTGFGAVSYNYQIGKYDVTASQYIELLNAKASNSDPLELWNSFMSSDGSGGIDRSGNGPYTYSLKAGRENHPAVNVTWYSAIRFANWINNRQGSGDTESGSYTLLGGTPVPSNFATITRNPGARWVLPSEDEWYKAAYYKGGGINAGYWDYPTQSDTPPTWVPSTSTGPNGGTNSANFMDPVKGFAVRTGYTQNGDYLADVGAYPDSLTAYGTLDQGGNAWQWNEEDYGDAGAHRVIRGGSFMKEYSSMRASYRYPNIMVPTFLGCDIGFRVVSALPPAPCSWNVDADGNWSSASNWDIAVPSERDAQVLFGFKITAPRTVTIDTPVTVGSLTFDNVNKYLVSGAQILTLQASFDNAILQVNRGTHEISAALSLAVNTDVTVTNAGDTLTLSGSISGTGKRLNKFGSGKLVLTGANNYTGGTTVSAGMLEGNTTSLRGNVTNNATVIFNQPMDGTFNGTLSGSGSLVKTGTGKLTFNGADPLTVAGSIDVQGGTLVLPAGLSTGGQEVTLGSAGTLEAGGLVKRAVLGGGTIIATDDLIIGDSTRTSQFNLGGAPGSGGTINVGSSAVVILGADKAILGSQTNLGDGGSLTTLHGAQLGNASSLDITKVLTVSGNATVNGDFISNGLIHGPAGSDQWLTFTQDVKGAGSTTGNILYAGSYSPGNSPAAVSAENLAFDPTSTLIMEIGGSLPGSQYDQLDIAGVASLDGTLNLSLVNGYTVEPGHSYQLIAGKTTGQFAQVVGLPTGWYVNYGAGGVNVVPEPSTLALLGIGAMGLLGYARRRRPA